LADEDEGTLRVLSAPDRALARGDLVVAAAEVDGAGAKALRGAPGDRPIQRVVHFEDAGSAAVPAERAPVSRREPVGRDEVELRRGRVEEIGARRRDVRELLHPVSR